MKRQPSSREMLSRSLFGIFLLAALIMLKACMLYSDFSSSAFALSPSVPAGLGGSIAFSVAAENTQAPGIVIEGSNRTLTYSKFTIGGESPFPGFTSYVISDLPSLFTPLPELREILIPNLPQGSCIIVHPNGKDPSISAHQLATSVGCK